MLSITDQFIVDMKAINIWAKSCKTKAHLGTVIKFFELKRNEIEPHIKYLRGDNLLNIGSHIGRVMQTLELKVETLKKEQEKVASIKK